VFEDGIEALRISYKKMNPPVNSLIGKANNLIGPAANGFHNLFFGGLQSFDYLFQDLGRIPMNTSTELDVKSTMLFSVAFSLVTSSFHIFVILSPDMSPLLC
ncbi:hypothetical protein Tco_0425418, partial [Tanacetum coccineum]